MITAPIINLLKDIHLNDNEKAFVFLLSYTFMVGFCINFLKRVWHLRNNKEKTKDE